MKTYRAKKVSNDEYIEGYYQRYDHDYHPVEHTIYDSYGGGSDIDPDTIALATGKFDINGEQIFASIGNRGGDICKWGHKTFKNKGKPTELSERKYQAKFGLDGLTWGDFTYSQFIYRDTENHLEIVGIE